MAVAGLIGIFLGLAASFGSGLLKRNCRGKYFIYPMNLTKTHCGINGGMTKLCLKVMTIYFKQERVVNKVNKTHFVL